MVGPIPTRPDKRVNPSVSMEDENESLTMQVW